MTIPAELPLRYAPFAEVEARCRSPLYEAIALGIAGDEESLAFLASVPVDKQQPNLVLASVRHLFGIAADWPSFRHQLLANKDLVRSVILARATQTNEPGRCAILLPILARLPQPLALIEVGASAGLCLLPEFYGYAFGDRRLHPASSDGSYPVFACAASAATPIPEALPDVVWRAGLDLNPLDAAKPSDSAWLETLVWPEQTDRLQNLRKALAIAADHRPRVVKGNLLGDDLPRLSAQAPKDATLVIFHTAVLAYVNKPGRKAFASRVLSLCPFWVSNEAPDVFPGAAGQAGPRGARGQFLLAVNGAPTAWTNPHGDSIDWIHSVASNPVV